MQQIQDIIQETLQYDTKRRTAKTETKRKYYLKKQLKNNKILADLLPVAEKAKRRDQTTATSNEPISPTTVEPIMQVPFLSVPEEIEQ
jgi:hypothetical protein